MKKSKLLLFPLLLVMVLFSFVAKGAGNGKVTINISMQVANVEENDPVTWAITQKFMKENPDIVVNLTGSDTDSHVKKMKMAAQANQLPDIFWMLPAPAKQMANAGYLLNLDNFLSEEPAVASKIRQNLLDGCKDNNFQYGLPYQVLVTGFWYNRSLFEKYGVKEPVAGTTFEEFSNMIMKFNDNNVVTVAQGAKSPFSVWAYLIYFERYGYFDKIERILNDEEKFYNQDFLNMYKKIDKMRKLRAFPSNIATMNYNQAVDMYMTGKSAMLNAGIWEAPIIDKKLGTNAGFWWGPTFSDGVGNQKVSMIVPTAPFVVSANVKKDQAKLIAVYKFFKFYYSDKAAQIMVDHQTMPVIKYNGNVDKVEHPAFAAIMEQVNNQEWISPVAQPDLVIPEAIQNAMYDSIYGVINGVYTPEEALKVIDRKLSQL